MQFEPKNLNIPIGHNKSTSMLALALVALALFILASAIFDPKLSIAIASSFLILAPVVVVAFSIARTLAKIGYGGIIPRTFIAIAVASYIKFAKNGPIPITNQVICDLIWKVPT